MASIRFHFPQGSMVIAKNGEANLLTVRRYGGPVRDTGKICYFPLICAVHTSQIKRTAIGINDPALGGKRTTLRLSLPHSPRIARRQWLEPNGNATKRHCFDE